MSTITGIVGLPAPMADGAVSPMRIGRLRELVVSDGRARYAEGTSRNLTFSASTGSGTPLTVVAANVSPVGAAAASLLTIYNPIGSGINAELIKTWLLITSGTPPAGSFVYNVAAGQLISATPNNGQSSGALPQSNLSGITGKVRAFVQTALTGGTGAQLLLRPINSMFAGAIVTTSTFFSIEDRVEGEIVVPPGGLVSIAAPAVGTTVTLFAGMTWQETPVQPS